MANVFGVTALLILILSVAVHIATFIPAIHVSMDLAWPLHIAALAVAFPMVLNLTARQKKQPKKPAEGLFGGWRASRQQTKEFLAHIITAAPRSLRIACVVAFIYTIINFAVFIMLMGGGSPSQENGKYYLDNHGEEIRNICEEEYHRSRAYVLRGFSGHWILFSLLPAVYFLTVYPKLPEMDRAPVAVARRE